MSQNFKYCRQHITPCSGLTRAHGVKANYAAAAGAKLVTAQAQVVCWQAHHSVEMGRACVISS